MLQKEEIYVSVESKEQAEMFRKVLEAMGEDVSFYNVDWFDEGSQLGPNTNGGFWLSNNYHKSPVESDSDQTVYKKITFGELIDLLQRKPLLISEDGVPLYEGDSYYRAEIYNGKWILSDYNKDFLIEELKLNHAVIHSPTSTKAFSSKKAALEWIEAQKPKSIIVELFTLQVNAICTSDKVTIKDVDEEFSIVISKEKLAEINKAMEELKNA